MTTQRRRFIAIAITFIGAFAVLTGAWCHARFGNAGDFREVLGVVIENAEDAKANNQVDFPGSQVTIMYQDKDGLPQQAALLVYNGPVPQTGETLTVSVDPSHPEIVFRRARINTPAFMMMLGALMLIVGGFLIRRTRQAPDTI